MQQESAVKHLVEAIFLNLKRGVPYGYQSGGRSLAISIPLIISEFLGIFVLGSYQLWGKWFNRQGINIIAGDFVPMALANELGAVLRFNGRAPKSECIKLKARDTVFMAAASSATLEGDFRKVMELTHDFLKEVLALEEQTESLFVMHRHILESVGLAAVNSIKYLEQSNGRTLALSKCFLITQIYAMRLAMFFDRPAQQCHQLGVGILENDVPYIPFLEAHASLVGDANGASGKS